MPLTEGLRRTIEDFAARAKANPRELKAAHQKEAIKLDSKETPVDSNAAVAAA